MKYLLVDLHNTMHRARHSCRGDIFTKMGLTLHIVMESLRQTHAIMNPDHVVVCTDGRSWRNSYFTSYKANRKAIAAAKTVDQQEEDRLFYSLIRDIEKFISTETNASLLYHPECEADDLVAAFIQYHDFDSSDNEFIILSSDTDYFQLMKENVSIVDGVKEVYYDYKNQKVLNAKTLKPATDKTHQPIPFPDKDYALFEKCIRGDKSDNIFSAYPGAREKGTKTKVGILDAFEDRVNQGYNWNNFMMQTWMDHNNEEKVVLEQYKFNKMLIDLTEQPLEIKEKMFNAVAELDNKSPKTQKEIVVSLLRLCKDYDLVKISQSYERYIPMLLKGLS